MHCSPARLGSTTLFVAILLCAAAADARNPIRRDFFDVYPDAEGSRLDDLPGAAGHCGICHFDFDGGGTRNPYGLAIEVRINGGMGNEAAILDATSEDSDNDGFSNQVEITDTEHFGNTPTFPGLKASNVDGVSNVDVALLLDYLTPAGGTDTTPPEVTVLAPSGGESVAANSWLTVQWNAEDESGVSHVDLYLGESGDHWRQLAQGLPDNGTHSLFIPNLPGDAWLRVVAWDNAGNDGWGDSPAPFTVIPVVGGVVPSTLRDFDLPGTQPFGASALDDPSATCITCHGDYDTDVEPWHNWQGSMMAQAMRDPLYLATMRIAEQDAPAVGDLCLRCHTPGGWQEGRSFDTTGGMLTAKDRQGVQCDYCHRMVDPHYVEGVSPPVDEAIIAALESVPVAHANGQFVTDPDPVKRGPYSDAQASHQFLQTDFMLDSNLCGTCHDVSNPAFVSGGEPGLYVVQELDEPHPDGDPRNMFPIERTFSEWSVSEFAAGGVYLPQFAGNRPDGMVSTCQDCHMRDVAGAGASVGGTPNRDDLGLHDLTGGNTFVPDILPIFAPGEVDPVELQAGKQRALSLLSLAATLQVSTTVVDGQPAADVRVINESAHKLPSGYPEGRRAWLSIEAFDADDLLVYESGAYDAATGVLTHDENAKIYHIEPGISTRLAGALGLTAGPSFHFALNDTVYFDNRVPPRGFTNAAFTTIQSPPVAYAYADGDYWDDTRYLLPAAARRVEVTLYYQTTSKEYIEFLRDANTTDSLGDELYAAWDANGKSTPVIMAQQTVLLEISGSADDTVVPRVTSLAQNYPNPFNPQTWIDFSLAATGPVSLRIYDGRGRLVRDLLNDVSLAEGAHQVRWDGHDASDRAVASGVYHYVLTTDRSELRRKMALVR